MAQTECRLCPRACGVDRSEKVGVCGQSDRIRVARAALHFWEEPCLSGSRGSGTVFFSGCPLGCCFCQNYEISAQGKGREIPEERLEAIFLELQEQGAHNLNLVSPTQFAPQIAFVLRRIKDRLHIPVVWNTGGYERLETLRMMEGLVDIWLPDLKYVDPARAARYAGAPDYFEYAAPALLEMARQAGPNTFDTDGIMQRGMIIRHLVLPGGRTDSIAALEWIAENIPQDRRMVSLMRQYVPCYRAAEFPEIARPLSSLEYKAVARRMEELGIREGYTQERGSADGAYTPPFDLEGV